jgi:hypothetical protein
MSTMAPQLSAMVGRLQPEHVAAQHDRVDERGADDVLYDVGLAGTDEQFARRLDEIGVAMHARRMSQ